MPIAAYTYMRLTGGILVFCVINRTSFYASLRYLRELETYPQEVLATLHQGNGYTMQPVHQIIIREWDVGASRPHGRHVCRVAAMCPA